MYGVVMKLIDDCFKWFLSQIKDNLRERDNLSTKDRAVLPTCPLFGGSTVHVQFHSVVSISKKVVPLICKLYNHRSVVCIITWYASIQIKYSDAS